MKQKFNAGADLDMLTRDEVREVLESSQKSWFNEVAKGDRYKRFSIQAPVLAAGTVVIGEDNLTRVGPNDGFVWSLKRLNLVATTAFDFTSDFTYLYINDAHPSSMVRQITAAYTQFGNNEVVLYPGDSLVVTSVSLTAGEIVTMSGAMRELPISMAWRLD